MSDLANLETLKGNLNQLAKDALERIDSADSTQTIENLRVEYFGKKGLFTLQMAELRNFEAEQRPAAGAIINEAKQLVQNKLNIKKEQFEQEELNQKLAKETIDVSLPGRNIEQGAIHPVSRTIMRITDFFADMGFTVETGPEIEDDYHNFDALNIPPHHPARADHDTFWFDAKRLLRTQTSGVQIRTMKKQSPPIRIIAPGRVYRNDYDQTHTPMFHQVEGLIVDKNITFANLKATLQQFLNQFFEEEMQVRFRPSYFPFTEPGAEVDVLSKNGKWLEVLGCGMVHPAVLKNVGIDPNEYSGFAFGMGVERFTMLRYGVNDLRAFFENDLRFLKQFK
ncbi:phenylalanine--tRNA ligase subunit alpha [Thorsellia kenyensis]|uniref:Phenylalanine--tRNA ligase alpha subunit n=1 Tax=Thorsellia kenyensis TaxID=1549888 RepID=A0ABV6CBC6_9GAMM